MAKHSPMALAGETPTVTILESAVVAAERAALPEADALAAEMRLLRQQLQQERLAHALQRANAEQARRAADCLRACHETLLPLLAQPCLVLDRDGCVSLWNDALAAGTGTPADSALGRTLEALFPPAAYACLNAARTVALHELETSRPPHHPAPQTGMLPVSAVLPGGTFALLPICRVPGCLEACLILFSISF